MHIIHCGLRALPQRREDAESKIFFIFLYVSPPLRFIFVFTMKLVLTILLFAGLTVKGKAQSKSYSFYQLYQLDSLGQTHSIGRHFGSLYFDFLQLVEAQLENADTTTQRLVRHFEEVFAQFYIDACIAYEKKQEVTLPAWRTYFSDSTLHPAQYNLLGTNAHLNGGLAEAIANSYTPQEWKLLKKKYVLFNKCLNETFGWVYQETNRSHKKAKLLSSLSLGLSKPLGRYYLYKWRKRQMRLTEYFFEGSPRYEDLLGKINRKKERIDKMIFNQLQ